MSCVYLVLHTTLLLQGVHSFLDAHPVASKITKAIIVNFIDCIFNYLVKVSTAFTRIELPTYPAKARPPRIIIKNKIANAPYMNKNFMILENPKMPMIIIISNKSVTGSMI